MKTPAASDHCWTDPANADRCVSPNSLCFSTDFDRARSLHHRGGRVAASDGRGKKSMNAIALQHASDPHEQLRRLYRSLLEDQNRFDEFKQLLALYPTVEEDSDVESDDAKATRAKLNARISEWLKGEFDGLSAAQVVLWKSIVVEERINVALSPWRESNAY